VNLPYQKPTNGPFQYIQFAASVGSIPAAGKIATLRWNWLINDVNYSFYLDFVSDGSRVDLVGGEDSALSVSGPVASLNDTNTWKLITLQFQKNTTAGGEADSRIGQTGIPQGLRFYSSSNTDAYSITLPGTGTLTDTAKDWILDVTSGTIDVDNFYWEGGMTGSIENSNLRALDTGAPLGVDDWKSY